MTAKSTKNVKEKTLVVFHPKKRKKRNVNSVPDHKKKKENPLYLQF
jgi:hypothetical protein